jgi:hypothetical protein
MYVTHASRLTKLMVVTEVFFLAILLSLTMINDASRGDHGVLTQSSHTR